MKIRFLGQSGYLLESKNSSIMIDPYLSDSVNRASGKARLLPIPIEPRDALCDAVICTHDHLDHLDPDTVTAMKNSQLFITTNGGKEKLAALGRNNATAIVEGESVKIGDFAITAVFADHTVEAFGVIVKAEGVTLYFSGDTLYNEKLFGIKKYSPDVTFICINGRLGNMNVEEALVTAKQIGARINIPTHYDMFASNSEDPRLFADYIEGSVILEFNKEYEVKRNGDCVSIEEL